MKIVHVIHTFPPFSRAGSENYCFVLAAYEAQRHDVVVFHRVADPARPEYEVSEDHVGPLPVVRINRTFGDMQAFEETYRCAPVAVAFGTFLDRVRPDVIHFHHVTCLSTTCVHEAKRRGIPVVYTLHDFWLLCPRGQFLRRDLTLCRTHTDVDCVRCMAHQLQLSGGQAQVRALWAWGRWLQRFRLPVDLYNRLASRPFRNETTAIAQIQARTAHVLEMCALVDRFVAPSRFLRDRYVEGGVAADKIAVHDYGFDTAGWTTPQRGARTAGPLRVVYLGTWIPSKGVHVLLEAFRGLNGRRAVLDVYGYATAYDGVDDYEEQLRALAAGAPHIRFGGAYTVDDVPRLLADADVLVVPSIWYENSPLTIHEAFLAGVPVVTSDHGGMQELVRDDVDGLTFKAGSATSLQRTLARLIDDPQLLERLRGNLPQVKSIEENSAEVSAIYASVLR